MNWLTPIGFLGMFGLVVLTLIYIIKPNYQNKRVPSTYIWRLSLRYKKQRIPISKLQDLLTFICQILILAALGALLASPVIEIQGSGDANETVIILDASAGMRIQDSGKTRFERAVNEAREKAESTFEKGSNVTFIVAADTPDPLLIRVGAEGKDEALRKIDDLCLDAEKRCAFSEADISGAVTLAESVLKQNSEAQVYLYTGTEYIYHNGVNIVNVASKNEWNAGILGCKAELDSDNHYKITVNAACYGKTDFITVHCKIHGVNGDPSNTVSLEKGEFFDPSAEEKDIVFTSDDITSGVIYSYDYIEAYVSIRDSFADDNSFFLYGGTQNVIKVQYASSSPNNFFESVIRTLRQNNRETWDVQFTLLKADEPFETEGFDIYIFEHKMPDVLPTDGIVLLVDPDKASAGADLQIGSAYTVDSSSILSAGISHELTKYTVAQRITIAKYNDVVVSEGYDELMFYNGRPVMPLKDTPESKVIVWAFDLNYSNLIALPDFSILIYNMFHYFIPETFKGNAFEVGDTVAFNGRGTELEVSGNGDEVFYENGKGEFTPSRPGTYTVNQKTFGGKELPEEKFFVKIPSSESDTTKMVDVLPFAAADNTHRTEYEDLLIYLAIAIVTLMFAEWILEIKKNY